MMNSPQDLPFEIEAPAVSELRQQEDFLFLDCREPDEFALTHIEGARLLPMQETPHKLEELESFRDQRIVVFCHHGMRSQQVAMFLRNKGFPKAQSMSGGIDAWSRLVDPDVPRY